MLRKQCEGCKRGSYRDGRCYADNTSQGKPVGIVAFCWAATPQESQGRLGYTIIPRRKLLKKRK